MPDKFRIFLLTVWRDNSPQGDNQVLRYGLANPRTGERRGFSNPEALLAFLKESIDK